MTQEAAASLTGHRLVICLGPGGVGKTTLSAALALWGALCGRAVDVMTVDPAPRLLDALALDPASPEPQSVNLHAFGAPAGGRLRALKLDPKHTFDRLVERYAPSPAARDAILQNRVYRNLSGALAGVGDYMAMEKLLELHLDGATERIVLDTPPAREALDFLDAPRRLLELINSRAITLLGASRGMLRPRRTLMDVAARAILSAFDRLTGLHLLADVRSFVASFSGMYDGFAERAERAQALLRAEGSLIVLVTAPERGRVAQTREFIAALKAAGLKVGALIVNRMMAPVPSAAQIDRAQVPAELKRRLRRNLRDFGALKKRQEMSLAEMRALLPAGALLVIAPDLGHEPRSLTDLAEIGRRLRITGRA